MDPKWFSAHLAYTLSKYGMSMCTLGMSGEFADDGIAFNSLWPRTIIATDAIRNPARRRGGDEALADAGDHGRRRLRDLQPRQPRATPATSSSTTRCSPRPASPTSRPTRTATAPTSRSTSSSPSSAGAAPGCDRAWPRRPARSPRAGGREAAPGPEVSRGAGPAARRPLAAPAHRSHSSPHRTSECERSAGPDRRSHQVPRGDV